MDPIGRISRGGRGNRARGASSSDPNPNYDNLTHLYEAYFTNQLYDITNGQSLDHEVLSATFPNIEPGDNLEDNIEHELEDNLDDNGFIRENSICDENEHGDLLKYWRENQKRFSTQSMMARDVLNIQASSTASESAFSVR
ncbi:hypothetical protein HAX54_013765, partial [Datura stramonium]|nr:hypothetical protein [Datura stramonium]